MTIEKIVGENIEKHFQASGLNITHFAKKISVQNGNVQAIFTREVDGKWRSNVFLINAETAITLAIDHNVMTNVTKYVTDMGFYDGETGCNIIKRNVNISKKQFDDLKKYEDVHEIWGAVEIIDKRMTNFRFTGKTL